MMKLSRDSGMSGQTPLPYSSSVPSATSSNVSLSNLYDPSTETDPNWAQDLEEDIREECHKFGPLRSVSILGTSTGDVILNYEDHNSAQLAVAALQGRWFGGRQIKASFLSDTNLAV